MSKSTENLSRAEIAAIIRGRGRQVNLYDYLRAHPEEFMRGLLVAGSIGSGKSQYSMRLMRAALDSGLGALVFDPSTDYQRLLAVEPEGVIIDYTEFYFNPLEPPPGMTLEEWGESFIQVFAQNFGLKDVSIAILQESLGTLIKNSKNGDPPPTLEELLEEVKEYEPRPRSSEQSSHASVQNRLETVLESGWGRCLNVRRGFTPDDFERGLLVIQIRPVGIERVQELVVGMTVAKIFAYRSWKQRRGQAVGNDMLVVIEEAHRFLSEARQSDRYGRRSHLEKALVESRKLGMGFIVVDQMPHLISSHVLGSCTMWVVCKLMDPHARRVIGETMCLERVWRETGLMELPVGAAFVRVEHMEELEDASPLVEKPVDYVAETREKGLPALIAAPIPYEDLFEVLPSPSVETRMCSNPLYMRYFTRNREEDLLRLEPLFPIHLKPAVRTLLQRTMPESEIEWEGVLNYCGLNIDRLPSKFRNVSTPKLDRYQVHALMSQIRTLSSQASVQVLVALANSDSLDVSEIISRTRLSRSWVNRVVSGLIEVKFVKKISKPRDGSMVLGLTEQGRGLLHWGAMLSTWNDENNGRMVQVSRNDVLWLVEIAQRHTELRDRISIAGWRHEESLATLELTFYLSNYLIKRSSGSKTITEEMIDIQLFIELYSYTSSQILTKFLKKVYPLTLRELRATCGLSESGLRKTLQKMEKKGIITRFWSNRRKMVTLTPEWKQLLSVQLAGNRNTVEFHRRLLVQLQRSVLEMGLLSLLIDSLQAEYLEEMIHRCFLIESMISPIPRMEGEL